MHSLLLDSVLFQLLTIIMTSKFTNFIILILYNNCLLVKQAFKDFENLPNLHINYHLVQHARNYATLLNTGVGTKEMVHRLFKNIVPRTNRKNVDFDLLKRYTTMFAVRHLFDGGIDKRLSSVNSVNNALMNLPHHLKRMMNDWFIVEKSFDPEEDTSEGLIEINLNCLNLS